MIDASIPLQVRGFDIGQIYNNAQNYRLRDLAMQQQQEEFALRKQDLAERRTASEQEKVLRDLKLTGALLNGVTPENYHKRLEVARRAGIDISEAPSDFQQQWVDEMRQAVASIFPPEGQDAFTLSPGEIRYGANGQVVARSPFKPTIMRDDNGNIVEFSEDGGEAPTGFDAILDGFILPQEGGFTPSDGRSGAPANFGINQKANPDIDVANLTPDDARKIYLERYWGPSGAENLSGPIQAIHFDTAVNMGVGRAKEFLEQSGGDPEKYMALREAYHKSLGGSEQAAWANRNNALRQFSGFKTRVLAPGSGKPQEKAPAGYRWTKDGNLEPIPGGPAANKQEGKILPSASIDAISKEEERVAELSWLVDNFKEDFSHTGAGVENFFQRKGYDFGFASNGQSAWWQRLESIDNAVRNELFGASLTPGEQAAWERTTVTPGMDAKRVEERLKARQAILKRALDRRKENLKEAGYRVPGNNNGQFRIVGRR